MMAEHEVPCIVCGQPTDRDVKKLAKHYLASEGHTRCLKCNVGFVDPSRYAQVCDDDCRCPPYRTTIFPQHFRSKHPERCCPPCDTLLPEGMSLNEHMLSSNAHPRCPLCHIASLDADSQKQVSHRILSPSSLYTYTDDIFPACSGGPSFWAA